MIGSRPSGDFGNRQPADGEQRLSATTDFDHNLVVTAGAGTGKTALLVERSLNLIGGGLVPIRGLAAITFTEKAAAELRERLARGLETLHDLAWRSAGLEAVDNGTEAGRSYSWLRARAGASPAEIARLSLEAMRDLDVASVSTIHAFCADILRRYPMQAGLDPDFEIDAGESFDRIFEHESSRFFATELGTQGRRPALWSRVVATSGGLGTVREIAAALAAFRFPNAALDPGSLSAPPSTLDVVGPELDETLRSIAEFRGRASGMSPRMSAYLESAQAFLHVVKERGPRGLFEIRAPMPIEEFLDGEPPAPGRGLTNADPEEAKEIARDARRFLRALASVDEEGVSAVVEAALPLAAALRGSVLRAGTVSFDGLLRLTRDLLAACPEVRRDLSRRHRTILVDEFQDTDPLQYEILFYILDEDGRPQADPYRTRLGPGRLFIVGDPKQSIYRFRGADIEAYQRAVHHVLESSGRQLTLSSSFRSTSDLVEPINRMFASFMTPRRPAEARTQPPYEPIDSARGPSGLHTPRLEIWSVEADGNADARRRVEAEALASWITAQHGSREATGEPLRYQDIAILLRALTHAGLYAQALRKAGVPFVVDGGKDFYERPEIGDLIAFLRAVANPQDQPAVLAVMRSILGGVRDAELARFIASGGRLDAPPGGIPNPGEFLDVARTLERIESFRSKMRGRPIDEVVRGAAFATPLALLHAAAFEGAQRVANLHKLVVQAESLARRGLSLEEVIEVLEDQPLSERDGGESPLADETLDAVRVLSIHRAKGLQYPVVFIPDIGRQERVSPEPGTEVAWMSLDGAGWPAVKLAGGAINLAWVAHSERTRRHEAAEEKRVFYVACTRARERLILVNSNPNTGRRPWREALASLGYQVRSGFPPEGLLGAEVLHRRIASQHLTDRPPAADLDSSWEKAAQAFRTVADSVVRVTSPPLRWPAGAHDARVAGAGEADEPWRGRRLPPAGGGPGRAILRSAGVAFHSAMQRWDFKDDARLGELVRQEAALLARDAASEGAGDTASAADELSREAATIVSEFLRSSLPSRLAGLTILGREVPILDRDSDGVTWVGACDLLYRDRDGTIVVVDYKTDRISGDAASTARIYADQIRVYRKAVSRFFRGSPVRAEILFVRTGEVVVMDSAGPSS